MWILRAISPLLGPVSAPPLRARCVKLAFGQRVSIQATCGFALFVLIYLVNPPKQFAAGTPQGTDPADGDKNAPGSAGSKQTAASEDLEMNAIRIAGEWNPGDRGGSQRKGDIKSVDEN